MPEHIKMPAVAPVVRYTADGNQTDFSYGFPIFASEDMSVYLDGAPRHSGFDISGAGDTHGGTVTFDTAPAAGTIITLERRIPYERMTDFLEGGDFSARAINNELDYLMASIQQVDRLQEQMIRYSDHETPANVTLPGRALRANRVLGFDGDGNPVPVTTEGTMAAPDFTASGTGAATRTTHDKFSDFVSAKDFGAVGDGLADDTLAIQQALAAHDFVYLPKGTYLITGVLTIGEGQSLTGAGRASIINAQSNGFNALEIPAGNACVSGLTVKGGLAGIKLFGRDGLCVRNCIADVTIEDALTGVILDGHDDAARPCRSNTLSRVHVIRPAQNGIHFICSGAGDPPQANHLHSCHILSDGTALTGAGIHIESGRDANSLIDCLAEVDGTAAACIRMGSAAAKTLLVNPYTLSDNLVPNILLDSGSTETAIINLHSASNGQAIADNSGGNYDALNSGWPDKNRLRKTVVTDLKATLMRYDTEYVAISGVNSVDLSHSVHLCSAANGNMEMRLPAASGAAGVQIIIKKTDSSVNTVTISEDGGAGPDGKTLVLGGENDYAVLLSNGLNWFILASNRMSGNTRYFDGTGQYDIDMAVDVYLLSAFSGALEARLPPADAAEAIGRKITIKKIDTSANAVSVSEQGGNGPDQATRSLSAQYDAITVVSDGSQWFVISLHQ